MPYPCQDPTNLPTALADALRAAARLPPSRVRGRCYAFSCCLQALAPDATLHVGFARNQHYMCAHYWLNWRGQIVDPTRQQFGRVPVTYWLALPPYAAEWVLYSAARGIIGNQPRTPELADEVLAATCQPTPAYQDQGWRRLSRLAA